MKLLKVISVVLFFAIGIAFYTRAEELVRPKQGGENADLIHSFYSIEKNSLDVLFFGSSLTYSGIQPNVLWHEYGIASCCLASPSQSFPTSYYLMQEALRYQKPKVIVLDSYAIWNDQMYYNFARLHAAADPMKMGIPKLKMLRDMLSDDIPFEIKEEFYFPFILYHERYDELTEDDYNPKTFLKGSVIHKNSIKNEEVFLPQEYAPVPDIPMEYLNKIATLCEENGIALFVVQFPMGTYQGDDWPTFTYDFLCMSNTFFESLDGLGIPYKFYQKTRELDLDWSSDYSDYTHLNANGAIKVSENLGAFLSESYRLPDHRGEKRYTSWDRDYELYLTALSDG